MERYDYSSTIDSFINLDNDEILGVLTSNSSFDVQRTQRDAWEQEITILKEVLYSYSGNIYLEYSIPRMGKRIDAVVIIGSVIFVIEFKVGEEEYPSYAYDQVFDYALDLKNFHETSHDKYIVPIMVCTEAYDEYYEIVTTPQNDRLYYPIKCNSTTLQSGIEDSLRFFKEEEEFDIELWEGGRYSPTPTIIEAAMALYSGHSVEEISRSDASAINLTRTTEQISRIIDESRENHKKSICFVTGVPGAGKTLVGLNIATKHIDKDTESYSVFLSGNGPLVKILREALTRDKWYKEKARGKKTKKYEVASEVKMFIQNVHNFRDESITDSENPPFEHVALFDEAQRAWDKKQTSNFMSRKKNLKDFDQSEPEYLISCMDRHSDWSVIVCLVGGGQEIHTGEAGISEWIKALEESYPEWDIHISPRLTDSEYGSGEIIEQIRKKEKIHFSEDLHLSVSMRSFRSENVSLLVKQILDRDIEGARETYQKVKDHYPIVVTRDLTKAKEWLRKQARGTERYGLVVSSHAERLKPYAIDIHSRMDPVHWFLDDKDDVRSSYYLEAVATEFQIQGLELDWVCVNWDADFRYTEKGWEHWEFKGKKWQRIKKEERKQYLKNAYRVLLTRARQGMVIVVPEGDDKDPTRKKHFYQGIFDYLSDLGVVIV